MRLGIFTAPNLAASNAAQFLLGAAWIPMFFFLNLYLQQVLGLGAFASGAALLPLTVTIMVGMIAVAPRLIARFGPKAMTVAGLATLAGGLVWLSFIRPDGSFIVDVLPASLVAAAGMAMAFIPSLGMALSSAAPEEGGLASGIVNTNYQVGSALGLAAMTAVATAFGADQAGNPVALTDGFSAGLLCAAGIAAAGAVLAWAWLRTPQATSDTPPTRSRSTPPHESCGGRRRRRPPPAGHHRHPPWPGQPRDRHTEGTVMSVVDAHDVVGMTCDHCARAVRTEVSAIEGVTDVDVDLIPRSRPRHRRAARIHHSAPGGSRRGRLHAGLSLRPAPRWVRPATRRARLQRPTPNNRVRQTPRHPRGHDHNPTRSRRSATPSSVGPTARRC